MNACAKAVMEDLTDIVFAYGVSDEYRYTIRDQNTVACHTLLAALYTPHCMPERDLARSVSVLGYADRMVWSHEIPDLVAVCECCT